MTFIGSRGYAWRHYLSLTQYCVQEQACTRHISPQEAVTPQIAYQGKLIEQLLNRSACFAVQDGSMRCDVNVSVRKRKEEEFGKRVEIKNMNSFSAMQKAIEFEIDRQVRSNALTMKTFCHPFPDQASTRSNIH